MTVPALRLVGASRRPRLDLVLVGSARDRSAMTLAKILEQWGQWQRASRLSERTITERVALVALFARRAGVDPLTCGWEPIADFLAAQHSAGTAATYRGHLRAFYVYTAKVGIRADDPTVMLARPRPLRWLPHPVTDDELARVLAGSMYRRTRMMILLAAYEGLRAHEIAKIRGEDLHRTGLNVIGKGRKPAVLKVHPIVAAEAAGYPARGFWFPSYRYPGRPVSGNSVSATIAAAIRRAGVEATAHSLRHWYATTMLESGASMRTVQENMRHDSLASTQIYTKVGDAAQQAAIDSLPVPLHVRRSRRPR
jgi:integrase/recombinase XerD